MAAGGEPEADKGQPVVSDGGEEGEEGGAAQLVVAQLQLGQAATAREAGQQRPQTGAGQAEAGQVEAAEGGLVGALGAVRQQGSAGMSGRTCGESVA